VCMNVWGRTMVIPFLPSPQLPDVIVSVLPAGLPMDEAERVAEAPGVDGERLLPMAVEQTLLGPELMAASGGDEPWVQLIGIEPERALLGDRPLLPLELRGGSVQDAVDALDEPMRVLLPPSFADRFGLQVGDELRLRPPGESGETVTLRIAGLAALPGWHWVTKLSRMRTLGGKPLAPLIVSRATATHLGIERIRHWYVDTTSDFTRSALRGHLQELGEQHAGAYTDPHFGSAVASGVSVKAIATGQVAGCSAPCPSARCWSPCSASPTPSAPACARAAGSSASCAPAAWTAAAPRVWSSPRPCSWPPPPPRWPSASASPQRGRASPSASRPSTPAANSRP